MTPLVVRAFLSAIVVASLFPSDASCEPLRVSGKIVDAFGKLRDGLDSLERAKSAANDIDAGRAVSATSSEWNDVARRLESAAVDLDNAPLVMPMSPRAKNR